MAAKFGVPLCPHAGGVGLCELVQHLSMFDYIAVSGRMDDRVTEFVDHLHEHFVDPVVIRSGRYMPPLRPGYSGEMFPASTTEYRVLLMGPAWTARGSESESAEVRIQNASVDGAGSSRRHSRKQILDF